MSIAAILAHRNTQYIVDFSSPIDISLPLLAGNDAPNAFFIDGLSYEPVRVGSFVGSVQEGGSCNCENITFNPHGNGTHTECIGHITHERVTVNQALQRFVFFAKLISVAADTIGGDRVITRRSVEEHLKNGEAEALIIRTLPNDDEKRTKKWSGNNPPYVHPEAAAYIRECGIDHLLIDLPSMDREDDGGKLLAHRAFWNADNEPRIHSTITEMIFVPDEVPDGLYVLNLQIVSFETDASPSKPVLYTATKVS